MMFPWQKNRVHEPVAVAALLAAAVALHAGWIINLVWYRSARVDMLGALYLSVACVYAVIFLLALAWCRGKDCGSMRDRAYHFFLVSIAIFVAMTLPFVYGFSV